jgi:hypothetical protein
MIRKLIKTQTCKLKIPIMVSTKTGFSVFTRSTFGRCIGAADSSFVDFLGSLRSAMLPQYTQANETSSFAHNPAHHVY